VSCSVHVRKHPDQWQWSDVSGGVLQRGRGTDVGPIPLKVKLAVKAVLAGLNKMIGKINDTCGNCWASLSTTGKGVPGERVATYCFTAVLDLPTERGAAIVTVGTSGCVVAGDSAKARR